MRPTAGGLPLALLLGLLFALSASALTTTSEYNTTLGTVVKLINVDASLDFPVLLPGMEYSKNVRVEWALPPESLKDITADTVRVHVIAYANETSWFVFSDGENAYKIYAFDLVCRIENQSCSNSSFLNNTFQAVLRVPANASAKEEHVFVYASLTENYSSIPAQGTNQTLEQSIRDFLQKPSFEAVVQGVQSTFSPQPAANSLQDTARLPTQAQAANSALQVKMNAPANTGANAKAEQAATTPKPSLAAATKNNTSKNTANAANPAQAESQTSQAGFFPSLISGLMANREQAVLYGAAIVFLALGVLVYKRFSKPKRPVGLFDA